MRNYLLYFFVLIIWTALMPFAPSAIGTDDGLNKSAVGNDDMLKVLTANGVVAEMTLDEYVLGVMLTEMPTSYDRQALLAQAVCIRSYVKYLLDTTEKIDTVLHSEALCADSNCCLKYITFNELRALTNDENATARFIAMSTAVYETSGEVLTYNGRAAMTLYHISSPARTESYGNLFDISVPYLTGVNNIDESGFIYYKKEKRLSFNELESLLMANGYDYSYTANEQVSMVTNENLRCEYIIFGKTRISAAVLVELLELNSACIDIIKDSDGYIISSSGYGSGLGMSQYGANILAAEGYTYKDILSFYFKGLVLEKLK